MCCLSIELYNLEDKSTTCDTRTIHYSVYIKRTFTCIKSTYGDFITAIISVIGIINRYLERKTVFAVVIETCWNTIIFLDIVQGQGNSSECQKFAVHDEVAESWALQIFDTKVDFPVPVSER